jgi:exopolysaccharide biosynthesis polyprenyl glycosylphosphotransferase
VDSSGILQKHWQKVLFDFTLDAFILCLAFVVAAFLRFETSQAFWQNMLDYAPSIILGAAFLPSVNYVFGLYSQRVFSGNYVKSLLTLALCLTMTVGVMMLLFYVNFSSRIGRGVMLLALPACYAMLLIHHGWIRQRRLRLRERVAFVVTSRYDESECRLLAAYGQGSLEFAGVVNNSGYRPLGKMPILGTVEELLEIVRSGRIDRVLCTSKSMYNPMLYKEFCQLRYSGVSVVPLISLCEEMHQLVPIELITPEWLINASGSPHVFYLKKFKRAFDILTSLGSLLFLGPLLLAGVIWVKLVSSGPALFRQTRVGRFGRPFKVIKLRTMRLDAEKDGAVWAAAKDPRVILCGNLLRKFRIDEVPQLVNVLRGEMSFVGPRPERPEFVEKLAAEIPYFKERLMALPGITGWAQVNYPYGASVEDARRKLEYDLYYMRHMSLFLDTFILLDTVRTILRGGAHQTRDIMPDRTADKVARLMNPTESEDKNSADDENSDKDGKSDAGKLKVASAEPGAA